MDGTFTISGLDQRDLITLVVSLDKRYDELTQLIEDNEGYPRYQSDYILARERVAKIRRKAKEQLSLSAA